ncbi:MAG: lysophospholipid acyltransferase family protein [Oscillospiraceae bacterium]
MHPIRIIAIIGAAWAAVYGIFSPHDISLVWRVPLAFLIGFAALYVALWLALILFSLTISRRKTYAKPHPAYTLAINIGYALICGTARIRLKATGWEKIPQGRFLLVCNHLSRFDNMLICMMLGMNPIAFISKPENFRFPAAGRYMIGCCYIPVERGSAGRARAAVERAEELIRSDISSVGVFPEGRRGNGEQLQKFRAGSLKAAVNTGCPIVVCAVNNTHKVHKRFPWRSTAVTLDVLDVIPTDGRRTVELSDEISAMISGHLYGN